MTKHLKIIGAGLAGLIAAHHFRGAYVYEAGERKEGHKALLRFRTDEVSRIVGVPFKAVTVDKGIYYKGELHDRCNVQLANQYAIKVTGRVAGRSIWSLDRVTRYIAPEDLYERLVGKLVGEHRLHFNAPVEGVNEWEKHERDTINTAPLPVILKACGMDVPALNFDKAPIDVLRYRIPGCDVYQTLYFPANDLRTFRASITGDLLIIEMMTGDHPPHEFVWAHRSATDELFYVAEAFGLQDIVDSFECLGSVEQQYGKIISLPDEHRHAILYELTQRFGIYSIGRFATWRNLLLDDVAQDLRVVERLIHASNYEKLHIASSLVVAPAPKQF